MMTGISIEKGGIQSELTVSAERIVCLISFWGTVVSGSQQSSVRGCHLSEGTDWRQKWRLYDLQ